MAEQGSSSSNSNDQRVSSSKSNGDIPIAAGEISNQLPLELIKSEIVPPSANRCNSTADWLPDFAGLSWIAYAASSLLVISHLPSPLSEEETLIGPIFRQVIELSTDDSAVVKAVAWSTAVPSEGDVAVAMENCVCLCSESSGRALGSFCWALCAVLVQSNMIEAIKWTGSGDGIITAGNEVVMWKKNNRTWEIAWKCAAEWPQTLVSATWSTEGPVATAVYSVGSSSLGSEKGRCVLVCQNDGKSGLTKSELHHPQPVSMIQWRPSTRTRSQRAVLLTCCLDGTVRLWSEIDGWRGKRFGKEMNDQKGLKRSFHVISVIEVNQSLNGVLGTNVFVTWAVEFGGLIDADESSVSDMPGGCEWLIGFGPGTSFTLWAIHCLDDISPLRFPRVTLWKKQQFAGFQCAGSLDSKLESFDIKTVISRSRLFGPPTVCSLFRFSSDNSMRWLQYTTRTSSVKDGFFFTDGHTGSILQVAVHPYSCEVGLAASLDSNGLLLLWSLSTVSNSILGMPMMALPTWKLLGKIVSQDLPFVKYSSVTWAPLVLNDYNVLLMGHTEGVDCFIVKHSDSKEEEVLCHKLCTIPFTGHSRGSGPTNISSFPLPSTCEKISIPNKFMLLGVWMNDFQALSWEVSLHFADLSGSNCGCTFDIGGVHDYGTKRYGGSFAGNSYSVSANPCSSKLPNPCKNDQVTSVAVVSPGNLMPSVQQKQVSINGFRYNIAPYHMATGFFDGSVKLWKSTCSKSTDSHSEMAYVPWELVGVFQAHQGPVSLISLSSCGQKMATISMERNVCILRIWETMHVLDAGAFLLADSISFGDVVTALSWLTTGNGQLLLGVSTGNEVQVYAQRRFSFQNLAKLENPSDTHLWFCIASCHTFPSVRDFLWGPGATPVLVHERYFSLLSKWSFCMDRKYQPKYCSKNAEDNSPHSLAGTEKGMVCAVFPDSNTCDIKELLTIGKSKECKSSLPIKINIKNDYQICNLFSTISQQQHNSSLETSCWSMLQLAEKLCGSLSIYHPEALLLNLYSGNWRRACVSLRHLVESLVSDPCVTFDKGGDSVRQRPSNIIPQIPLPKLFDEQSSIGLGNKVLQWGRDAALAGSAGQFQKNLIQSTGDHSIANGSNYIFNSTASKSEISSFIETLEKCHDITGINSMEKTQMLAVIDVLDEITDSRSGSIYESLDAPGRRFWVAIRFKQLYSLRRFGRLITTDKLVVDSELMGWAYHSDCQENLFNSILSKEPTWREMRNLGVGYWSTNRTELRTRMEKLARSQYLKNKDPKDCALLYIALNRIQVLAGLFKISKDEKDKPLVGFLSRNFQEEKNKAAALKNAYVLMGRHQLELAIAFFLLGGDPSSAVTVCARNLGDEQLALVICRLVEGCSGPLECQLISKFLLPSAIEKGDYWLVSLLEWAMGNYSQSFLKLLGLQLDSLIDKSVLSSNLAAFSDPKVGQYSIMLATKNHMKNSVGEHAAATLVRLATIMTSKALNRCGLPLEALEVLSSSVSAVERKDQGSTLDMTHGIFHEILKTSQTDILNWLSGDVALHLESNKKLDLASQYISKLIKEHPNWPDTMLSSCGMFSKEDEASYYKQLVENCQQKLKLGLTTFEQKYSISSVDLMNMILVFSCNNGLFFHGYHVLHGYVSQEYSQDASHAFDSILLYPPLPELFLKAIGEFACFIARYLVACSTTLCPPKLSFPNLIVSGNNRTGHLNAFNLHLKGLVHLVKSLRDMLKIYCPGFLPEDLYMKASTALELIEYYVFFASMWLQRNMRGLILLIHPIFVKREGDHIPSGINFTEPELVCHKTKLMIYRTLGDLVEGFPVATCNHLPNEQSAQLEILTPDDERWLLIGACIWTKLSYFNRDQLKSMPDIAEDNCPSRLPRISSLTCNYEAFASAANSTMRPFEQLPVFLAKLLRSTFACISSSLAKQLVPFFSVKVERWFSDGFLVWLEEFIKSQPRAMYNRLNQENDDLPMVIDENRSSLLEILWEISTYPKEIREGLLQEKLKCLRSICQKSCKDWRDLYKSIMNESENGDNTNNKQGSSVGSISPKCQAVTSSGRRSNESHSFVGSRQKDSTVTTEVTCFENPEVICKRNGELLEVMCINSIDQRQAALASNRKGIVYFTWKDDEQSENHSDFVWSEADWPRDGWAGSESTPIPTPVSPGIGLGSKKGAHLGLGGATIGSSLAIPGRDLTGGGAFGIPGYAGIGASSLGWGTQEDFEEFVDPPATVDNIHTRALSSHPSRPFFLVGSSNTHAYLWEFGKEKATATYGMLPAANVPPPYALASISALQFDHCGHRFATAALDGTVCTWQLEVGGRNNIPPTESSLCFNSHASDITYVAASGSVIAAAGHSSNDVNVVIWDTLAPPTSSQASLMCHQGGARSISVFDNDIGSGSISPLIVTGGTGGDVGLHDFRFIATGKTKYHRHSNVSEENIKYSSTYDAQSGNSHKVGEIPKGMLWYIPKAHLGSVTRIATIPNTSFFLTGSKDGDVKLWDAARAKLVFHWPKLHERHTFLQPSSRGFGGVVRAAVTDIQVLSHGFLACGGDGTVKLVKVSGFQH